MNGRKFHFTVLLLGVFFLSTSAIFVRVINAPSYTIAFYRMFISGIFFLLPIILWRENRRSEMASLTKKQIVYGLISGVFLSSHYVLWFESLNYTSVASSTVLVTLQPLFAVAGGLLLYKDKVGRISLIGILISICGSVMIGWQDFQADPAALYGDLLAFTAAGLITVYFFIGRSLRSELSILPYSVLGYFSSSVVLLVYGLTQSVSLTYFFVKYFYTRNLDTVHCNGNMFNYTWTNADQLGFKMDRHNNYFCRNIV